MLSARGVRPRFLPGISNIQLLHQPLAEYFLVAGKGIHPANVELSLYSSSRLRKWILERICVDQPLEVGNELGAYEGQVVFLPRHCSRRPHRCCRQRKSCC